MDVISGDLFAQIEPIGRSCPYALFGHSMGALLALMCALRARDKNMPLPEALFVSACATPDTFLNKPPVPVSSFPPDQEQEGLFRKVGVALSLSSSMLSAHIPSKAPNAVPELGA